MIKTIILSMCLAASSLSLNARAQEDDERAYTEGPVTEEDYIGVEYGHFEEYIDWLNSTWKPTMEAMKKAGLIIDYKVFRATPKSPDQPNINRTLVIPAVLLLAAWAAAQTTPAQMKNPVSTALRDILPGRQKNTVAAVEAMPADKFNYKPTADQMPFGHLVVHMAETNYLLCSKAAAVPAPKDEEVKDTDSKDKLVAALRASFDFCSDALTKMDDSRLAETTEIFPGRQGSRAWASLILAGTWADHYAEAAMYLRLIGVLPPTAKK